MNTYAARDTTTGRLIRNNAGVIFMLAHTLKSAKHQFKKRLTHGGWRVELVELSENEFQ